MWDIEHEAAAAGGGGRGRVGRRGARRRASSAATRETPGFDERAHLEAVISHGAPPFPILRRIMLGEG